MEHTADLEEKKRSGRSVELKKGKTRQREEEEKERTKLGGRRRSVSGQWGKETHTAVLSKKEAS